MEKVKQLDTPFQHDLNRTIAEQAEEIERLRSENSTMKKIIYGLKAELSKLRNPWTRTAENQPDKRGKYLIINNYGELLICPWNEFKGWAIGNGVTHWMPLPEGPKGVILR